MVWETIAAVFAWSDCGCMCRSGRRSMKTDLQYCMYEYTAQKHSDFGQPVNSHVAIMTSRRR